MANNTPQINFCLYVHINPVKHQIFYVGMGKLSRAFCKRGRSKYWHNVVNKYDYDILILEENLTWSEAGRLEIDLIKKLGRKDLGKGNLVNMTNGGDGVIGYSHTEETKHKIGCTNKGRGLGRKLSRESVEKMRLRKIGLKYGPCSEERKKNISLGNSGKKRTIEAKNKMSLAKLGKVSLKKGKHFTKKAILQLDLNNNILKEYNSVPLTAKEFGGSPDTLYSCLRGKQKTAFGYKWKYK